ncbi:MAG: hypothetical protein PVJ86_01430 [Phycisphaerales bacterium]|jgi:prophage tail gpP-like protein
MITVEVNNIRYSNFKEIAVNASLEDAARNFSFTTVSTSFDDFPMKTGDSIGIYADNALRLTGYIERVRRFQNPTTDVYTVSGRSKTADLIDSTIDHRVQFKGKQSLRTVAETLVWYLISQPLPQDDIAADPPPDFVGPRRNPLAIGVVIDEDIEDFRDDEDLDEELGQTYFEIIEKFARKRSVLVTTNGKGDLVFTRGKGYLGTPFKIRNVRGDSENNMVKEMSVIYDVSGRFNTYDASSQPAKGTIRPISEITPDNMILGDGRVIDPNIRVSRKRFFVTENSSTAFDCQNRAAWEKNVAKSKSVQYEITMQGHSFNGNVWDSNISVDVLDDFANIEARMLVNSVSFRQSVSGGATTKLVCLPPNAFTFPERKLDDFLGERYQDIPLGPF